MTPIPLGSHPVQTGADYAWLTDRWMQIGQRVNGAFREAGRDSAEVDILPVNQTFGPDVIRAVALGLHCFGENQGAGDPRQI